MTSLISLEVERRFAAAKPGGRRHPVTGEVWIPGIWDEERVKRIARRALLAQENFAEYGPPNAPPLPLNSEDMTQLAKTGDFGLAVASFAFSLERNEWDVETHPRYPQYVAGLLSLPHLRLALGTFREPQKLCCYYGAYPLRGLHGNGVWHPVH
jgi:hypothetical protein